MTNNETPSTTIILEMVKDGKSIDEISKLIKFPTLADCFNELIGRADMPIEHFAKKIDINRTSIYRILNGTYYPARNILLRTALAFKLSYEETEILLKSGRCAPLSSSSTRDLYIMRAIEKHTSYIDLNTILYDNGFIDLDNNNPNATPNEIPHIHHNKTE